MFQTVASKAGLVQIFQIRFSFQSQVPGLVFFRFRFLHITAMKVHATGRPSKGSEAVEAFILSTSSMHYQQLLLT